jgi:threonine/homoserine/homoserine lactone efflux protein
MLAMDPQLLTFIMVVGLLTMTPGADTMLVLRNVLSGGRSSGFATTMGINSGLFVHATLSAQGLSVILVQSAAAYEVVKTVGAAYLIYLGARSLYQVLRQRAQSVAAQPDSVEVIKKPFSKSYSEGFLTNVLNPKVAIFYLAFLPQFIRPGEGVLLKSLMLAAIHAILGFIWLGTLSILIHRGRDLIQSGSFKHALESISGVVLIGLGLRLILEKK